MTGAVAVVDVDDGDARSAAVEHRQQRREALEGSALAHRRRHRDDRRRHEARDDAGKGAVHARDDDDGPRGTQLVQPAEDAVQPGDPDVDDEVGAASEVAGDEQGLTRDGQVRGAGGDDEDGRSTSQRRAAVPGPRTSRAGPT
ncbi:hypothetical protein N798_02290 [Knoellia flava TL1]|uniref:Uncharacterized protein n=2 Tax=Knoellia flava TaxID=913969 RepID=A0A8H9FRU6_9MICO|nr:hypothetical protein N798_02290 [Knoellia flava TL1]GGB76820.1 hypothetical protein GCM10011314_15560 [Knoellia flava]